MASAYTWAIMTDPTSLPRVLVVTSCTGEKQTDPPHGLSHVDFLKGKAHLQKRELELQAFMRPAGELYTGMQHLQVRQGMQVLHEAGIPVRGVVVSAGYGVVPWDRQLAPYDVTFSTMGKRELDDWAKALRVRETLEEELRDADLVVFLLGEAYLRAAGLPQRALTARSDQALFFVLSAALVPRLARHKARQGTFGVRNQEAKDFRCGLVGLKGKLLLLLAREAAADPARLHQWHQDPSQMAEALEVLRGQ